MSSKGAGSKEQKGATSPNSNESFSLFRKFINVLKTIKSAFVKLWGTISSKFFGKDGKKFYEEVQIPHPQQTQSNFSEAQEIDSTRNQPQDLPPTTLPVVKESEDTQTRKQAQEQGQEKPAQRGASVPEFEKLVADKSAFKIEVDKQIAIGRQLLDSLHTSRNIKGVEPKLVALQEAINKVNQHVQPDHYKSISRETLIEFNKDLARLSEQIKIAQDQVKELNELSQKLDKIMDESYHDQLKDAQQLIKDQDEKIPQNLMRKLQECTQKCIEVIESDNRQTKISAFSALQDAKYNIKHHFTMKEDMDREERAFERRAEANLEEQLRNRPFISRGSSTLFVKPEITNQSASIVSAQKVPQKFLTRQEASSQVGQLVAAKSQELSVVENRKWWFEEFQSASFQRGLSGSIAGVKEFLKIITADLKKAIAEAMPEQLAEYVEECKNIFSKRAEISDREFEDGADEFTSNMAFLNAALYCDQILAEESRQWSFEEFRLATDFSRFSAEKYMKHEEELPKDKQDGLQQAIRNMHSAFEEVSKSQDGHLESMSVSPEINRLFIEIRLLHDFLKKAKQSMEEVSAQSPSTQEEHDRSSSQSSNPTIKPKRKL